MIEYLGITIGLIVFGDAVLVPAIYLALFGHLNLWIILLLSFLVSNLMDVWWYHVGKKGVSNVFRSFSFVEKYERNHPKIMEMFFKHQLKIIFWSRFLHGSGISIMILSGIYRVPFKKYILMNVLSSIVVLSGVTMVEFFAKTGTSAIFHNIKVVEWSVAIIVLLIFISIRFKLDNIVNKILFFRKKVK